MTALREKLVSLKDEAPNWLFNAKWSALKPYTHRQQKCTQQVVIIYLYICVCVCALVCAQMCVGTHACASQRLILGNFLNNSVPCILKQDLSLNLEFIDY